jgi:hypothetical protein
VPAPHPSYSGSLQRRRCRRSRNRSTAIAVALLIRGSARKVDDVRAFREFSDAGCTRSGLRVRLGCAIGTCVGSGIEWFHPCALARWNVVVHRRQAFGDMRRWHSPRRRSYLHIAASRDSGLESRRLDWNRVKHRSTGVRPLRSCNRSQTQGRRRTVGSGSQSVTEPTSGSS